jgi:hypothetical protein
LNKNDLIPSIEISKRLFMKQLLIVLSTLLLSFNVIAKIYIDIDFKNNENNQKIELKKKFEVYLNETKHLVVPNSNKMIKIKITNRGPESMENNQKFDSQILIDLKLIENIDGVKKVISSPKVITLIGKEVIIESFKNDKSKKATMTLKVLPTRI